jgi:hypothetical protein
MPEKVNRWMGNAFGEHPGALHRQLNYSQKEDIPRGLLDEIQAANIGTHVRGHLVTTKLWRRANAAVNAR